MLRPDLVRAQISAELAQEQARIALPATSSSGARRFGAMFDEVRREITSFISDGSGSSARALSGAAVMNADGYAQLAKLKEGTAGTNRADQQQFIASIAPWARDTAARLGIEPELVAAHAALESGWGQHPLRNADGTSTHNLFGIKAAGAWTGDVARALTTEMDSGTASKRTESFRSYAGAAQAFDDYAQLLLGNQRYAGALNAGGDTAAFAAGLAQGRYATDPDYAQKIERVARQVREIGLPSTSGSGVR